MTSLRTCSVFLGIKTNIVTSHLSHLTFERRDTLFKKLDGAMGLCIMVNSTDRFPSGLEGGTLHLKCYLTERLRGSPPTETQASNRPLHDDLH